MSIDEHQFSTKNSGESHSERYLAPLPLLIDEETLKTVTHKQGDNNLKDLLDVSLVANDSKDQTTATVRTVLLRAIRDDLSALAHVFKNCNGTILHVESRPSKQNDHSYEVLLKIEITHENLLSLVEDLKQNQTLVKISITGDPVDGQKEQHFPRHVSELDLCNHVLTRFQPDLDQGHPGFTDKVYRARRTEIADIAFSYKHGAPIPRVAYTEEEHRTWGVVYDQLKTLLPKHACRQYVEIFKVLEREVGFCADNIPQLEDVSNFLKRKTGFSLRPGAGLLTARDFLASLAFRVFQCTQYVRHSSSPNHSPEPDCIHELLGHIPLLADPDFAQFSQDIGLASLGASDEDIAKFSTMYWFTMEFGLCKEKGQLKAYGAGLLSSYGELLHALSGKPQLLPYDPDVCAVQPYQDQTFQDTYFVADSFEDAQIKFRRWVDTYIRRDYELTYNPFTQSVSVASPTLRLQTITRNFCDEAKRICAILDRAE